MVAAMPRPTKHKTTGIYQLRRRVPTDLLRSYGGKREIKVSLGTRELAEANRRYPDAAKRIEQEFANRRSGATLLSERQALSLAQPAYDTFFRRHQDNPSGQTEWRQDLYDSLWKVDEAPLNPQHAWDHALSFRLHPARDVELWCLASASDILRDNGLTNDEVSRLMLAKAVAAAMQRASHDLQHSITTRFSVPYQERQGQVPAVQKATFTEIFDGWVRERKPVAKTEYEWRRAFFALEQHFSFDDVRRLTVKDVRAWKDALVARNLSAKTINDSYLAAVRSILQRAVDNDLLSESPAKSVRASTKKVVVQGVRGFDDKEAKTILEASHNELDPILRWIPYLLAYTGARLSEICQLRREDLKRDGEIWYIDIKAEAGSIKTASSERRIPLHTALLEQGFTDFALGSGNKAIFSSLKPNKFGSRGGQGTKIVGRWVRSLGVSDPRLSPAHSWRHRFKTIARQYDLSAEVVNALLGHAHDNVGSRYGEFPLSVLHRELSKIPSIG